MVLLQLQIDWPFSEYLDFIAKHVDPPPLLLLPQLCFFSAPEGYLPQQFDCRFNNHIKHGHDRRARARSHCSAISANKRGCMHGCVRSMCMNIMGWQAVVLSGREMGVAEWAAILSVHGGGGKGNG